MSVSKSLVASNRKFEYDERRQLSSRLDSTPCLKLKVLQYEVSAHLSEHSLTSRTLKESRKELL